MKKILLVTDVYGWSGDVQAKYTKKYLSDEFHFDIMDGSEFSKYTDLLINTDLINHYDLIYLLFHTMLLRKDVTSLLKKGKHKIISLVSAFPTLRASFIQSGDNKDMPRERFLNLANRCVGTVANSIKSLDDLKSIYDGKTFYAPFGVDDKVFYPTREFVEKPEDKFTVAFVGKPNPEKGFEIIKRACQMAGVRLIDNQRNYTNALSQDEMRDFYNSADAYLVASIMDGTPIPALESGACGLPIVTNAIGNMPELIKPHKNGWMVEERTVEKYANRLRWMKRNQKASWDIGQKGREAILKDWTWKTLLNKNERLIFRELLNEI